jgi:hypothetical protein
MGICGSSPPAPAVKTTFSAPAAQTEPAKRVRTGVESIEDRAGEGDGCDRCFGKGCDEELCCPSFWQDEGVPPIWPLSWVFSRMNPYLNDNDVAEVVGNCGFKSADRERKTLMGTALAFTVVSIILTTFGCLALSTNRQLVMTTAWAVGHLYDPVVSMGSIAYIGLSKLVITRCAGADMGMPWTQWTDCATDEYHWHEVEALCAAGAAREGLALEAAELAVRRGAEGVDFSLLSGEELSFDLGYPCAPLLACQEQALANQFGTFITCATLIFALIGCLTRIRKRADTNLQKIIGTLPDLIGIMTLGGALIAFSARCTTAMVADEIEVGTGYAPGPGFLAYCVCWVSAVVRFSMHAIMPVPNAGVHVKQLVDAVANIAEDGVYDGFRKGEPKSKPVSEPQPRHQQMI